MLRIERPDPQMLIISQRPTGAVVRLIIWVCVVFLFYLAVLGDGELIGKRRAFDEPTGWHEWMLLLFPLFLLPYLSSLARSLRRGDAQIFDGRSQTLSGKTRLPVSFADIKNLRLRTVHGTCEEFRLSAVLADGRSIDLLETEASAATEALAQEISELLNVSLVRMT